MSITENVISLLAQIRQAATEAGRDPESVTLCAATKMNGSEAVREAIRAGVRVCGENRVQELTVKLSENAYEGASVHFIGHLQTNKVKQVVGKVDLIQSVDSLRLLSAIDKEAAKQGIIQNILLEVNIGGEESKSGFAPADILPLVRNFSDFPNICLKGLMAIPPVCEISGGNNKFFQEMYNLSVDITAQKVDNVCVDTLSMGMSDDFTDAIRCGSTMVRVGTAIFGARNYTHPHL